MGTRLLFGAIGLITALLAAYGLERLLASWRITESLQGTRVLLFRSDPEIVRRLRERGAQFGNPQFSLMWHNINDLDLHCIEPTGTHIWFRNRRSEQTGGELDVDANADPLTRTNRPVENIYWQPSHAHEAPTRSMSTITPIWRARPHSLHPPNRGERARARVSGQLARRSGKPACAL
jgi:hypothetical protein